MYLHLLKYMPSDQLKYMHEIIKLLTNCVYVVNTYINTNTYLTKIVPNIMHPCIFIINLHPTPKS